MGKPYTTKKRRKVPQIRFERAFLVIQVCFLIVLGLFSLATVVFASDTSDAEYIGIVRITNNSTAETAVSVNCSIFTQVLIDAGYINTSCNNTSTLTPASADIAYMPAVGSNNNWAFWVSAIASRDVIDYKLYAGGVTDMAGKIRYFPGAGGMTTADNATIELGNNFTIEQKGWVDTDNGSQLYDFGYLVHKPWAFRTYVSDTVSGNITSAIISPGWFSPTGFTDPTDNWTNEIKAYDEDTLTYTSMTIPADDWSENITFTVPAIYTDNIRYWADYNAANINICDLDAYYNDAWHDVSQGAFVDKAWQENSLGGNYTVMEARFRLYNDQITPFGGLIYEVDFRGESDNVSVTATGISSGEHTVTTSLTENLLANGSFENGDPPTGWTAVASTLAQEDTIITIGSKSLKITYVSGFSGATQSISDYERYAGRKVTFSAWVRIASGNTGTANLRLYDGAGETWGTVLPKDDTWDWRTVTRTIDDTPTQLSASLYIARGDGAGGDTGYMDGAILVEGDSIADYGNLVISIDESETGVWTDNATYVSVPGNSANWTFFKNYAMPYMEYQDISVNGTQVQYIEWENAAIFSDNTSFGNDATPTFRVTSSDPNVSAELISFRPIAESEATGWDVTVAGTMIGDPSPGVGPIPEMFTENVTAHLPGAGFFNDMLAAGGHDWSLFWIPIPFILIVVIGIMTFGATRSLGLQAAIMAFGIAFFATLGPIPFVPVIIFVIDSVAVIMMSKQIGW